MRKKLKDELQEELVESEEIQEEVQSETAEANVKSEITELLDLWDRLKALGVNSISDLEVRIARLKN